MQTIKENDEVSFGCDNQNDDALANLDKELLGDDDEYDRGCYTEKKQNPSKEGGSGFNMANAVYKLNISKESPLPRGGTNTNTKHMRKVSNLFDMSS